MLDLSTPNARKLRRDWGLQNMVGMTSATTPLSVRNEVQKQNIRRKIAGFIRTAVYPHQLTMPRQYATTSPGCWVYKILEGREIPSDNGAKYREKGIRVVVQENAQQARFIMSPLFGSKHDALAWAVKEMGAEVPPGL